MSRAALGAVSAVSEAPAARQVAYLVNLYPSPSHSFIRREIQAIEAAGWVVHRFAHRHNPQPGVEPADDEERQRTCVLLDLPWHTLAAAVLAQFAHQPLRTGAAAALALRLARRGDRRTIAHAGYFVMACVLARQLQALGSRHLHAHFGSNPAAVACLVQRLGAASCSLTFHGPHEFDPALAGDLHDKLAAASFVATVSEDGARRLGQRYPQFAHKVVAVPCGLDAAWLDAPPSEPVSAAALVCVARLEPQKDPLLLLDAASLLVGRGLGFRLTVVGDGSLRAAMQARIDRDGLSPFVVLAGWQSQQQVIEHLVAARALVLSSRDEGLPVAIMEAFAMGRAVIAPNVGGVRELVRSGMNGWLLPRGDARALADAMHECLVASPDTLRRMSLDARQRLRPHDVRRSAARLIEGFTAAFDARASVQGSASTVTTGAIGRSVSSTKR